MVKESIIGTVCVLTVIAALKYLPGFNQHLRLEAHSSCATQFCVLWPMRTEDLRLSLRTAEVVTCGVRSVFEAEHVISPPWSPLSAFPNFRRDLNHKDAVISRWWQIYLTDPSLVNFCVLKPDCKVTLLNFQVTLGEGRPGMYLQFSTFFFI